MYFNWNAFVFIFVFNPLVKVDVQLARIVLTAHHEWLLQSLDVLSIQALVPLTEVLSHKLIHDLDHLGVVIKHMFAGVWFGQEMDFLKHLVGNKGVNKLISTDPEQANRISVIQYLLDLPPWSALNAVWGSWCSESGQPSWA